MKKASTQPAAKSKSTSEPNQNFRILYSGTCPKLTARGKGDLSYELSIDDTGDPTDPNRNIVLSYQIATASKEGTNNIIEYMEHGQRLSQYR